MNKFSLKKDLAVDFLYFLFKVLNKDAEVEQTMTFPYPSVETDTEYTSDWLFIRMNLLRRWARLLPPSQILTAMTMPCSSSPRKLQRGVRMSLEG